MEDHNVDKLYIKLFDVDAGYKHERPDWKMVPIATTQFKQKLPDKMDVVPVIYITVDAIGALGHEQWIYETHERYASLIVKRIDDMMQDHWGGSIREVQIDCDWTAQTELSYFALAQKIKEKLNEHDIILSGTLRLHQLHQVEEHQPIPFDRLLLMCYNTGQLQDATTRNSILDFDDVKPYLKQYHSDSLPRTDVAFPVYTWGVEFNDAGDFVRLVNSKKIGDSNVHNLRVERGEPAAILKTQSALPMLESTHTTLLYHLDSLNLSQYSYEDIEAFYSR